MCRNMVLVYTPCFSRFITIGDSKVAGKGIIATQKISKNTIILVETNHNNRNKIGSCVSGNLHIRFQDRPRDNFQVPTPPFGEIGYYTYDWTHHNVVYFPVTGFFNHGFLDATNCIFLISPQITSALLPNLHEKQGYVSTRILTGADMPPLPISIVMTTRDITEGEELFMNYYGYADQTQNMRRMLQLRGIQHHVSQGEQEQLSKIRQYNKLSHHNWQQGLQKFKQIKRSFDILSPDKICQEEISALIHWVFFFRTTINSNIRQIVTTVNQRYRRDIESIDHFLAKVDQDMLGFCKHTILIGLYGRVRQDLDTKEKIFQKFDNAMKVFDEWKELCRHIEINAPVELFSIDINQRCKKTYERFRIRKMNLLEILDCLFPPEIVLLIETDGKQSQQQKRLKRQQQQFRSYARSSMTDVSLPSSVHDSTPQFLRGADKDRPVLLYDINLSKPSSTRRRSSR